MWTREFVVFLFCGGAAALANMGSRMLFSRWLPYVWAIALAYGVGLFTAFILFRRVVFVVSKDACLWREIIFYILVNAVALAQTMAISVWLAEYFMPSVNFMWHKDDVAHAVGVLVPVITSYLGHKYLTFRKKDEGGVKKSRQDKE